jgi:S-adenosylmethionine synthetase
MTIKNGVFTSEAVSAGHPDKICDQVSDAILDACLANDPHSHVAIETAIKDHTVMVFGEITTDADPDFEEIVKSVLGDIGHLDARWGLDRERLTLIQAISKQSSEIAHGVGDKELGAGDQGMMFGYATNETSNLMPAPIDFASRLMRRHSELRQAEPLDALIGPDAKSQVSVAYADSKPSHITAVVLSTQHSEEIGLEDLRQLVREQIIEPELSLFLRPETVFHINPAGTFHSGGPIADSGLTGRKIIADTYGGFARHGGGAFSGKDASKVDRSGAYAVRQIARHAVSEGWVDRCEIEVAYAIGYEKPVSVEFVGDSAGDAAYLHRKFKDAGIDLEDILRPASIVDRLQLNRPVFRSTASGGHFGRSGFPWEENLVKAR